MALTANQKMVNSAETVIEIREKNFILNRFNQYQSHVSRWQNGDHTVKIPIPDFTSIVKSNRARGGDWPAAVTAADGSVSLTRSGGAAGAVEVLMEDAAEISYDIVQQNNGRMRWDIGHGIDTDIYDAIAALPSTTVTLGTAGSYFISRTAPYNSTTPTGSDPLIISAIEDFSGRAYRLNVIDGDFVGGTPGRPFMVLHPELVRNLRRELRDKGLSLDRLTDDSLKGNVGTAVQYFETLMGVNIFSWNHLAVPTGSDNWELYAAMPAAVAVGAGGDFNKRATSQTFTPDDNQISSKPAHLHRETVDYAYVEVLDALHFQYVLHAD